MIIRQNRSIKFPLKGTEPTIIKLNILKVERQLDERNPSRTFKEIRFELGKINANSTIWHVWFNRFPVQGIQHKNIVE